MQTYRLCTGVGLIRMEGCDVVSHPDFLFTELPAHTLTCQTMFKCVGRKALRVKNTVKSYQKELMIKKGFPDKCRIG